MQLNIITLIIAITTLISMQGFAKPQFMHQWAFIPYEVKQHRQLYRYISHAFVHADWPHLMFNMFSFYFLGSALLSQTAYPQYHVNGGLIQTFGWLQGNIHFILIYVLGGIASTFWPLMRNHDNPGYLSVGASGSVSAIIFAMILWSPMSELEFIFLPGVGIPCYLFGPIYLAYEFWALKRNKTNIAHDAHIGGAIFGIFYVLIINIDKGKELFTQIFAS